MQLHITLVTQPDNQSCAAALTGSAQLVLPWSNRRTGVSLSFPVSITHFHWMQYLLQVWNQVRYSVIFLNKYGKCSTFLWVTFSPGEKESSLETIWKYISHYRKINNSALNTVGVILCRCIRNFWKEDRTMLATTGYIFLSQLCLCSIFTVKQGFCHGAITVFSRKALPVTLMTHSSKTFDSDSLKGTIFWYFSLS